MNWFQSQSVVLQAFIAGLFTWGCTIIGSAIVFFFKHISRKLLDIMMGFAAGVMIAASFWSLLQPSIEYAENSYGSLAWLPAAIGFLTGGFFLRLIDAIVEPVGALLGAVAVLSMTAILPYALSFAAGAMIFVVVEELIPDSQTNGNTDVATLGLMVGFVIMMILDVALG